MGASTVGYCISLPQPIIPPGLKATHTARNILDPSSRFAHAASRGAILSHLIGVCFFLEFVFAPAFPKEILYTRLLDWPIRILGVWLLLNRFGKQWRPKLTAWDWTHVLFVAGYGFALTYAELFMIRDTGLVNYINWANHFLNGYFYFLVVRESCSRRGFRVEIVVRWLVGTLSLCCLIALAQAKDFGGMRMYIDNFYHQAEAEMLIEGPSKPWQARAPAVHANSLAIMLVCGLPLLVALSDMRRLKWWDYLSGALIILTLFMTFSRVGVIGAAALSLGLLIALLIRKEYAKAGLALFAVFSLVLAFVIVVYAFDIARFKVLLTSLGSDNQWDSQTTIGWKLRQERLHEALALAEKYPVSGIGAASGALNQEVVLVKNAYTYPGLLLNVYAYSFVKYGLLGVAFLIAMIGMMLSQMRNLRSRQVFATTMVMLAFALLVTGISENVLFSDEAMITVDVVMAFCVVRVSLPEVVDRGSLGHQAELPRAS